MCLHVCTLCPAFASVCVFVFACVCVRVLLLCFVEAVCRLQLCEHVKHKPARFVCACTLLCISLCVQAILPHCCVVEACSV